MNWPCIISIFLASGLFLGIGGRLVMWIIAMVALGASGFSFGGTLEVIASGVLFGVPAAILYAAIRKKLGTSCRVEGSMLWIAFLYYSGNFSTSCGCISILRIETCIAHYTHVIRNFVHGIWNYFAITFK